MRESRRFVSGKLGGLVTVTCPDCGRRFPIVQAKLDEPAVCTYCSVMIECPAQHRFEPALEKLKIPLKGTIVTSGGSIELDDLEAESDAYTGRNRAEPLPEDDPLSRLAEGAAASAATRHALTHQRKSTRKIRAARYRFATIFLVSLVVAGVGVFIWLMHTYLGKA